MPTYLIHGFRWHRPAIRIHVILYDLEDAAPEWIIAPASSSALIKSFYTLYNFLPPQRETPSPISAGTTSTNGASSRAVSRTTRPSTGTSGYVYSAEGGIVPNKPRFNDWSVVKLMEQYDVDDLSSASQPYAFVGDYMVDVRLSADIASEMADYEDRAKAQKSNTETAHDTGSAMSREITKVDPVIEAGIAAPNAGRGESLEAETTVKTSTEASWIEKLRDQLQKEEKLGWYIVHCGDEDRDDGVEVYTPDEEDEGVYFDHEDGGDTPTEVLSPSQNFPHRPPPIPAQASGDKEHQRPRTPRLRTMRSFFGRKEKVTK